MRDLYTAMEANPQPFCNQIKNCVIMTIGNIPKKSFELYFKFVYLSGNRSFWNENCWNYIFNCENWPDWSW